MSGPVHTGPMARRAVGSGSLPRWYHWEIVPLWRPVAAASSEMPNICCLAMVVTGDYSVTSGDTQAVSLLESAPLIGKEPLYGGGVLVTEESVR